MPTTPCLPQLRLDFHPQRPVDLSFDAPQTSSDGGLLLLRQLDERLGLCARVAACLPDAREAYRVVHSRLEQVRQRVLAIALGYEDQNDATSLRHDPLWRAACDRMPDDVRGLSSQPTLSRLEHAASARDVVRLQRQLEADYVASLPEDTVVVVLDLDSTSDPTHGQQPFAFFHGHYGLSMYFPLLVFDGEGRLVSVRLRPGNAGNNRYATPLLVRLVRAIKTRFPAAQVVVRADSGFCTPRLLEALEALDRVLGDVDYVIGLERNPRLQAALAPELAQAAAWARPGASARVFTAFRYRAKRWSRPRYVVAKAEQLGDKSNPRFVLTTLEHVPPRFLYENGYCGRGDAENRIKDFKNALVGDRLSCTTYVANAFRLLLHAFAYRLLDALRTEVAVCAPTLGRAQFDTLRLRLLKTAALVRTSVRRIAVALPATFPLASIFARVAARLGARERGTPPSEGGALALAG
jgi:Transposase DDE domain group 1